jgi:hypothetical protein
LLDADFRFSPPFSPAMLPPLRHYAAFTLRRFHADATPTPLAAAVTPLFSLIRLITFAIAFRCLFASYGRRLLHAATPRCRHNADTD